MRRCNNCGFPQVESHHIFFGSGQRKISDKMGWVVDLCPTCHRSQPQGVHGGNRELDLKLKRNAQLEFEKTHSRKEFMDLIGRNYIED